MLPPMRSAASAICSPFIFSVPRTSISWSRLEIPAVSAVSDLFARDGAKALDVAQLVLEPARHLGDAVGGGDAVGRLVGEGVFGLGLRDGELALLVGRALPLEAGDLLENALLRLLDVGR